jgi:hypothetical protein
MTFEECVNQTTHENLIRINNKLPDDQKVATLIHEIIGSANTTFHDKQHELLDAISEVFTQVCLDNDLLKWMKKKLTKIRTPTYVW